MNAPAFRLYAPLSPALISVVFALGAAPPEPTALDQALELVPKDAVAFVVVPSPKRASDDLQQCIERMDRPEAAVAGRPIDQLKAYLKIGAAFDDNGTAALAQVRRGEAIVLVAFVPVTDGPEFLTSNFKPVPDQGADAWKHPDGMTVFARVFERHVALSLDAEAVRALKPDDGIAVTLHERLGDRGVSLLARGDAVAWAGPDALGDALKSAAAQRPQGIPQAAEMTAVAERLLGGLTDGLVVVDFDPLGVGIRTFARAKGDSELAGLLKGGTDHASKFDRLPRQPFYGIARADVDGLGGIVAIETLFKAIPQAPALPAWLTTARDHVHALQFGVYPSKLGIATGGLLNDSNLFIESDKPEVVREGIQQAILATAGEFAGIRREPGWTRDKELKGGGTADAFEVKESAVQGSEQAGNAAMAKLVSQAIFGSRGFVGFVKPVSGGVAMTFSQRIDVLERGVQAGNGGKTFADDATIASYRSWLIDGADIEAYLGVAQLGKLMQQLATIVPGGDGVQLPQIPATAEPVAFAIEVDRGSVETAAVVPSSVLAIFYDQVKNQLMGGARAPATKP